MKRLLRTTLKWLRAIFQFVAIELVGRALYYSGGLFLIGLLRQRFGRRRLLVPMYHRVRPTREADEAHLLAVQQGVDRDRFDDHLRVWRWFGPLLSLDEAFDHLHDTAKQPRTVVALTLDDGYRDSLSEALPVLQRHGASATVFPVIRSSSGGRALWWDELAELIRSGNINGDGLVPYLAELDGIPLSAADRSQIGPTASRAQMAEFVSDRITNLPVSARERVLEVLAGRLGVPSRSVTTEPLYANWEEVRKMTDSGIEIGGHTVDHPALTSEEVAAACTQIINCRQALEQKLGRQVRSFSYPHGRHDATVRALTALAGFRLAVTVEHGVNYVNTDPYQLRRVPVGRERPFHLALKLAFYGLVHRK